MNDDDERSCYAILLLHNPWPNGNEDDILGDPPISAVECLKRIKSNNKLPEYVEAFVKKITTSQNIMDLQGEPDIEPIVEELESEFDVDTMLETNCLLDEDEIVGIVHESDDEENIADGQTNIVMKSNGFVENVPLKKMIFLSNFIATAQRNFMDKFCKDNQLHDGDHDEVNVINYQSPRWIELQRRLQPQNIATRQKQAYDIVHSYITSSNCDDQLLMFMSGEGGTGKSEVIKLIMESTRLIHGKQRGLYGAVVALAPTGVAANNIDGFTWHSVCKMNRSSKTKSMTLDSKLLMGKNIQGLKLIIIDEVSMISCENLFTISQRFKEAKLTSGNADEKTRAKKLPFGGIHVLFVGDFYQLPPVFGSELYCPTSTLKSSQAKEGRRLWCQINKFVELDVNYRLQSKDEGTQNLAKCVSELRVGHVTRTNLDVLNRRLCGDVEILRKQIDPCSVWLASTNNRVDELNIVSFNSSITLSPHITSAPTHFRCIATYSPNIGNLPATPSELDTLKDMPIHVNDKKTSLPAFIDLAIGSRVRCIRNKGTQIGVFNGAMGTVVKFVFNRPAPTSSSGPLSPRPKQNQFKHCTNREIPIVLVKMDNVQISLHRSTNGLLAFSAEPDKDRPLKANGKIFYRTQLPLELAHASTVHKYQGLTAPSDVVVEPAERPFSMGIEYVAISRTTKLESLHLLKCLRPKHFNSHSAKRNLVQREYERMREGRFFEYPQQDIHPSRIIDGTNDSDDPHADGDNNTNHNAAHVCDDNDDFL